MARAAHGLADDLLTNVLLTAQCPVLFAPAMHTEMWLHAATQANVALLRERGTHVLEPASGRLTGADTGPGRLPEPDEIAAAALALVSHSELAGIPQDLVGKHVLVSAGGTREALDPVRFLGNRSSGRQGVALAADALARGAKVTLVAGAMEVEAPEGADVIRVESALQMRTAVLDAAASADVVMMAAAVADFRPAEVAGHKIKKSVDSDHAPVVRLVRNPDILAELVASRRPGQLIVGFAAETGDDAGDVLTHARAKLARKGCDLLVVNDVSAGQVFGRPENQVTILDAAGPETPVPAGIKAVVATLIWDVIVRRLRS
jgi:phosphopantothenoylcysteine decarboxylase/phosphopantothenate--cysteine ligase